MLEPPKGASPCALVELSLHTRPAANQIYAVRFRFPEDETNAKLLAEAKQRAANPNLASLNIANANSNYGYKGSSANKPVTVFDDGTKTWFRFEGETLPSTSSTPIATKVS